MPEVLRETEHSATDAKLPERGTVAVCVCTFRRPAGLRRLLESLVATIPRTLAVSDVHYEVRLVLVDNEPTEPNRSLTHEVAERAPWPLEYVVEPRRGIAHARNAAFRTCRETADFVAWIDDDEIAAAGWLEGLLSAQRETGADVVAGPIVPRFESPPAGWIEAGKFFERPRFPDRSRLTYAYTCNALVTMETLALWDPPFEESLALAGGEDTYFFRKVFLAGKKIVWADDALVFEFVPASRMHASWLLRRAYRRGTTLSLTLVGLEDSWRRRLKRTAHAGMATIHGISLLIAAPVGGRATLVRALQRICFAAGLLTGLTGRTYVEYTHTHGT
jgi:succinoglycan biosynthesis protein ExoM